MRFVSNRRRHQPAIIIVSLIDIMIVLLLFLMVTTSFRDLPALKLKLPDSKAGAPRPGVSENPPVIVTVTTNAIYIGRRLVTPEQLQTELKARTATNRQVVVAIRADTQTPYGYVIKVTEAATTAQVKEIKSFVQSGVKPVE